MEKKIKVCFLYESVFTLGGVQTCITAIANYLIKQGSYDITILCTNLNAKVDRKIYGLDFNVKVKFIPERKLIKRILYKCSNAILKLNRRTGIIKRNLMFLKKIYYFYYGKDLEKIIEQEGFDIVISSGSYFNVVLSLLKSNGNYKRIGWQHSSNEVYFHTKGKNYWNQEVIVNEMFKKLDKYIVLTEDDRKGLLQVGYQSITLYNPLRFKQKEKSLLNNKKIIAVGRLTQIKGFDRLIKNFKKFVEYNKDWTLEIFGDGQERSDLVKLVEELELNEFIHIKHRTDNISEEYKNASIYCMTSKGEGMPMVILEAMESGLPIIAYELPCLKEILINDTGILVKQDDEDVYCKEMLKLANNRDLREKFAQKSIKRARDFSLEIIGHKWDELLQELYGNTNQSEK